MDLDDRTTSIGLFNYARSYWQSAEYLNSAKLDVSHKEAPVTFLFYHSIELYLKSFLRLQNLSVKKLRDIGHKVDQLSNAAVRTVLLFIDTDAGWNPKPVLRVVADGYSLNFR